MFRNALTFGRSTFVNEIPDFILLSKVNVAGRLNF